MSYSHNEQLNMTYSHNEQLNSYIRTRGLMQTRTHIVLP